MPSSDPGSSVVRFGDFELDLRSGELTSNGHRTLLADQPFRLLALLIRARGQVVSRDELRRELWSDDTFVDFELSLNAAIRRLREALGDSATTPRFIQTLPRRGYRFIADVSEAGHDASPATGPPGPAPRDDAPLPGHPGRAGPRRLSTARSRALMLGGVALAGALAFLATRGRPAPPHDAKAASTPRMVALTHEGTVRLAALSPDGAEIAYVCVHGTQEALWMRRLGAATALRLIGPADGTFRSLSFGPDGFVYYTFFQPDRTNVPLYRVSTRGGEPAIVNEAAGGVSFSPDGARLAHVSSFSMPLRESRVIVADAAGASQRVIAVRTPPRSYLRPRPAWSPDSRRLAVVGMDDRRPLARELIVIDVETGREHPVATVDVSAIEGVLWPGGAGVPRLIVSMRESRARPLRLWEVSIASGERRPLAHDGGDYTLTGLSADGRRAIAVRSEATWSLYAAALADLAAARPLATGEGAFDLMEGVSWTPGGELVFAGTESGNLDLWRLDPERGTRTQLTFDPAEDFHPAISPDGRTVAFASTRSGSSAIWATPIDGERPRRLTGGDDRWPSWSPDGRWVAFQRGLSDTAIEAVWRVFVDGGEAERIGPHHSFRPVVSPDARSVAHYLMNPEHWVLAVTPIGRPLPAQTLPIARTHGMRVVRWSSDGKALAFIDSAGGAANVWRQPLDGGPAERLTDFADGTIETFDWSRDGSRLAWIRVAQKGDVVAVELN